MQKYTLRNGLPVYICETSSAPVVTIQAWVTRGSVHETEQQAGISHFLEHALFKGTRHRDVGQIALEIESHGGEINAFTSFDETAYYTTLASRYFEEGLDVIADAIQYPSFDADEMNREKEVILEEIKRAHDSAGKMVSTNLWKGSFSGTPYGRPVLGFEKTVEKIGAKTLHNYFSKNYHAGSVALFIVGDVDAASAMGLVKKKLSKMKTGGDARLGKFNFPTPTTPKVLSISRDISECQVQIGFSTPGISHGAIPALDLAYTAIGQGESSRLYQRLVKESKLALDAQMGLVATNHCGIATLGMATIPDKLEAAISEWYKLLGETIEEGLTSHEIERVKNSLEAEVVGGKETVGGRARRLGYYYCQFGDPDYEKRYLDEIMGVTPEDAIEHFHQVVRQKPVISIAHPTGHAIDKKKIQNAVLPVPKTRVQVKVDKQVKTGKRGSISFVTKNVNELPIISVKLIFEGGSRAESVEQQGIMTLFKRVWTSGSKNHNSYQLAHTLESLGASIHAFAGRNSMGIDIECLTKQWPTVRPIVEDILYSPTFPVDEFDTEKELLLRDIMSLEDSPAQKCQLNFLRLMYPDHAYGRPMVGTEATVSKLQRSDLENLWKERIHQSGLVVTSVGNFPTIDWEAEMSDVLSRLPKTGTTPAPYAPVSKASSPIIKVATKQPLFQSHLLVGFLGASFQTKERYALKLLSSCLAGQGGRLFLELRDKHSLAYSVAPMNSEGPVEGTFAFYIGCSPEKLGKSLTAIRKEIDKVINKPMPATELRRAKEFWLGRFELELQRYASQAALFGLDEFYGLGANHYQLVPKLIKTVTSKDIQAAAAKFLTVEAPVFSIVHPEELSDEQVLGFWNA